MAEISSDVKVSVCCLTFNQEKYIENCLKSLLMQKTTFKYEIIIHDDGSTDRTIDIIKKYVKLYPNIVRLIAEKENKYSQGGIPYIYRTCVYPYVRGKFVAYCEGDDYWTDPFKLMKQVNVLESNPDCHMCVHKVCVVNEEGEYMEWGYPQHNIQTGKLSSYDFMKGLSDGFFFHTSSFMCRMADLSLLMSTLPDFYKISDLDDVPLLLYLGQLGMNYYINEPMSCYRRNSVGSWTEKQKCNVERIISHKRCMIELYQSYDIYTNGMYKELVQHWINNEQFMIAEYMHDYKEMAKDKYSVFLKKRKLRFKFKVKMFALLSKIK